MKRTAFLMASSCALALMVGGQTYAAETKTKTASSDTADTADTAVLREKDIEEIVVSSSVIGTRLIDSLQGISVVSGEELERRLSATIGDALDNLPGIAQSSFGPGASRPIIRGLGGDRIRVLLNGIGTIDVSTTSPDHAVAAELATADRVEVIRGPATLAYGNNATGGVVNVFDGRIPTVVPEDGLKGNIRGLYGTNADEVLFSGGATASLGGGFVAHASGFFRDTGDIEAPGFVESPALRAFEEAEGGEEEDGEEEERGTVENSAQRNYSVVGGLSFVGERGFFGVSVSYFDNLYGIPGGHSDEEGEEEGEGEEEEETIQIDIAQTRVDVAGDLNFDGFLETARFRFGYADFEQEELEGVEIGTVFENEGYEARLELVHDSIGAFKGAFGVQYRDRDFSALGEEAFVVPNDQQQIGFFVIERGDFGALDIEAGLRAEFQQNEIQATGLERNFGSVSGSLGGIYDLGDGLAASLTAFYTERAPNAEELFSNGAHLATNTFEIGNRNLDTEKARTIELGLRQIEGPLTFAFNAYYTDYEDYIGLLFTGQFEEGLPVARFDNEGAQFYGFELDGGYDLWRDDESALEITFGADYVRARLRSIDADVPFIPPLSIRAGVAYTSDFIDFIIEADWNDSQNNVFADDIEIDGDEPILEFPTGSFVDVTATLAVHPFENTDATFYVQARNLLDEDIRFSTSSLRDIVPAPGFDLRFGFRMGF